MHSRRMFRQQQLNLFQSPPVRMAWMELPEEVRRETTRLLTRLLAQHLLLRRPSSGREVRDER